MDIKKEIKRLAMEVFSYEFPSEKQMKDYIKDHPLADTSKHWVKQAPLRPVEEIFTDTSNLKKIGDIIPSEEIGKDISKEKFEHGKRQILSDGVRKPITVREKDGKLEIVDGNTTFYILKEMEYNEIPVTVDNNAKSLRELQREAILNGVSKDELTQVLPNGKKSGNSKSWLTERLKKKTAMEFDTQEQLEEYKKEHDVRRDTSLTVKKTESTPVGTDYTTSGIMRHTDDLPAQSEQKYIKSAEDFYSQAQESFNEMSNMLDMGHGLDVKIGAKVITPESRGDFVKALETDKPVIVIGSIKKKERAEEKVNSDYGGDWGKLKDGVRSTISVKNISELANIFNQLEELGLKLAQKPKDRYKNPTVSGYRDILLNVMYPNGHIGEIQINCHDMIKAKMFGHKIYEKVRTIESAAKKEGRDSMTDAELVLIADANKRMKMIYESAYRKISRGVVL
jgi:hypothetical protein